jgi:hypothetical protein
MAVLMRIMLRTAESFPIKKERQVLAAGNLAGGVARKHYLNLAQQVWHHKTDALRHVTRPQHLVLCIDIPWCALVWCGLSRSLVLQRSWGMDRDIERLRLAINGSRPPDQQTGDSGSVPARYCFPGLSGG